MIDILSNLLGETVEVVHHEYFGGGVSSYVSARGVVRAIYGAPTGTYVVIENTYDAQPYGALRGYDITSQSVRVVRLCRLCGLWDHPDKLDRVGLDADAYEHKNGRCHAG